jgi:excisionase family DNA binding protein
VTDRLLTPVEVAEWAQVSERTVRRAISRGDLRAGRAGGQLRIEPEDARRWVFGSGSVDVTTLRETHSQGGHRVQ